MGSKKTLCHDIAQSAPGRTLLVLFACTMLARHAAVARLTVSCILCLPRVSLWAHL